MIITQELINRCNSIIKENYEYYTKFITSELSKYQDILEQYCTYISYYDQNNYNIQKENFLNSTEKTIVLYTLKRNDITDRLFTDISLHIWDNYSNTNQLNLIHLSKVHNKDNNTFSIVLENHIASYGFISAIRGTIINNISKIICDHIYNLKDYSNFDITILGDSDTGEKNLLMFCDEMIDKITILKRKNTWRSIGMDRMCLEIDTVRKIVTAINEFIPDLKSVFKLNINAVVDINDQHYDAEIMSVELMEVK